MIRRIGGWVGVAGGALVILSPMLPWVAEIEHAPGGPSPFHVNGLMAYSRVPWLSGRTLIFLGALCVAGGLVALQSHGPIGGILAILAGLAVAGIGLLDDARPAAGGTFGPSAVTLRLLSMEGELAARGR